MSGLLWRLAAFGLLMPFAGWFLRSAPAYMPGREFWPLLVVAGPVLLVVVYLVWQQRWHGSAGVVARWSHKSRKHSGVAGAWVIWRTCSAFAMRRKAKILRPSFRELSFWQRLRLSPLNYATPLATVGRFRVWSACEDVSLRIGGPRSGKTGELACRILDASGAVIATSTRTDVIELTGPVRRRRGPVYVFNPSGVGGLASSIVFDPLAGCTDPTVAVARAADLLAGGVAPGGAGGDREFWAGQARRVLASLMHAAALGGADMTDVLAWVADPDAAAGDVLKFLRRSAQPAFASDAAQFLNTNDRTRSSICSTIMPALGWLTDATASAAAGIGDDGSAGGPVGFDVAALLETQGTVYMLGAEDGQTAPLVCALTGHIARQARKLAALNPGGRLDPPLTVCLDEAALICPVPLDNWTADMGGRGVTIHIAVQSRAQLRQRWGDNGAAAILNNTATLLIYGGMNDPDDLAAFSVLTGHRDESTAAYDPAGNLTGYTTQRVPVLSAAQIGQLPHRRVVILRRGMPAAIGRVHFAWKRRDVRRVARVERWAPRLAYLHETAGQAAGWSATWTRRGVAWAAPHLRRLTAGLSGDLPAGDSIAAAEEGTVDAH